jgi:predicted RNA-binding protein YlqC (UPF0109 family)
MSENTTDIAAMVRDIVEPLADDKDAVSVEAFVQDDGTELVEIRVAPDDCGKIIGRQGRVIKSIRTLVRAAVCTEGRDVSVELIED